jgi:hypothetical protein
MNWSLSQILQLWILKIIEILHPRLLANLAVATFKQVISGTAIHYDKPYKTSKDPFISERTPYRNLH